MVGKKACGSGSSSNRAMRCWPSCRSGIIIANYQETQLENIAHGQSVDIHIDTFPGQTLKGQVDSIAPASGVSFAAVAPENATGNFTKIVQRIPVKIVFDSNKEHAACCARAPCTHPGMPASVPASAAAGRNATR
ncbi:HlyD family efflux transporter periplasmic adaptor subunit [Serratia ureilytica]